MANNIKISGFNIYKDKKHRDIYYDVFTKNGYIITKYEINKLNFYQKRFVIPVIIFALTYSVDIFGLSFGIVGASAASILSYVCLEFFFRFRLLNSMSVIPNFVPDKQEDYFHQLANKAPLSNLIIKGLLYIALGVLLVIFGFQENFQTIEWIVCIILTIVVVVIGSFQLYAASIKLSMKK